MTEKRGCAVSRASGANFGLGEWERDWVSIEEKAESVCEDLQWVKKLE